MNFKEIIEAWIISYRPTKEELELAEARGKVCDQCASKIKIVKMPLCKECGCPIGKKIFTNNYDPCPLHKWHEIDKPYFPEIKQKKTII